MAFEKKTWEDRITEYPTRRTLTHTDGTTEMVTVARSEGTISKEGDAFSAANMNNLEGRIESEFNSVNGKFSGCWIDFTDAEGNSTTEPYIHWLEEVQE